MLINKKAKSHLYIKSISDEAATFNGPCWWSARISSKNRFFTELFSFLEHQKSKDYRLRNLWYFIGTAWHLCRLLWQILYSQYRFSSLSKRLKSLNEKEDLVICKSFAYDSSFDKDRNFQDPFLKDLIPTLKNFTVLHLIDPQMLLAKVPVCSNQLVVPYQYFITPLDLIRAYAKITAEFLRLCFFPRRCERDSHFFNFYRSEILSSSTLSNFIFASIAKNIKRYQLNPTRCFYTYENNGWERMFILGLRSNFLHTKIFGVQHTVISESSTNMYIGETESTTCPQPDVILASGEIPLDLLKRNSFTKSRIELFGTTRYQYLHQISQTMDDPEYDLLVVLEGVSMASDMIGRLHSQWDELNQYKILIRPHPAYPQILRNMKLSDKPNVKISSDPSVQKDISNSKAVLYLGSACAFEAIKIGRPVIAFKIQSTLDYDPLSGLESFKRNWHEGESLAKILTELSQLDSSDLKLEQKKASLFVEKFFSPISKERDSYF